MKFRSSLTMVVILLPLFVLAQSKMSFEHYYLRKKEYNTIMPIVHIQTANNWHGELRYNYEEEKTISFYAGKTIGGGKNSNCEITPMIGYAMGRYKAASLAFNAEANWKSLFASSQTQYSFSSEKYGGNCFFTWSEVGVGIGEYVYTGVAAQYTLTGSENIFEPGLLAGINLKYVSVPVYVFNTFKQPYFVVGLNYEINLKGKKPALN